MQIQKQIRVLADRIDQLEQELADLREDNKKMRYSVFYKLRKMYDQVIKISRIPDTDRWFLGPEWTEGTRLRIPGRPRRLRARLATGTIRRRDISSARVQKALGEDVNFDGHGPRVQRTV